MKTVLPVGSQDIELSSRLLDVTNVMQLEEFLSGLVTSASRQTGHPLTPGAARDLVSELTRTAVKTVPTLSAVLGVGGSAGSTQGEPAVVVASRMFGLELEGLSAEDRDYEIARQFVRFAQAATAGAATAPAPRDPVTHDLTRPAQSGRWVRKGNTIVLIGPDPSRPESNTL